MARSCWPRDNQCHHYSRREGRTSILPYYITTWDGGKSAAIHPPCLVLERKKINSEAYPTGLLPLTKPIGAVIAPAKARQ